MDDVLLSIAAVAIVFLLRRFAIDVSNGRAAALMLIVAFGLAFLKEGAAGTIVIPELPTSIGPEWVTWAADLFASLADSFAVISLETTAVYKLLHGKVLERFASAIASYLGRAGEAL